jgi:hypothetical protein
MSGSELAGDLVEAALVARAVDQIAAPDGHTHETTCLNCGTALTGPFCHACGQGAHVHRTIAAFFHDLLHGVFHFEGRIWRTLPLLAWNPGALTRRYIDGQRTRFVSPLALFLFCVFVMFAVFQQTAVVRTVDMSDKGRASIATRLADLQHQRQSLVAQHRDTDEVDTEIEALNQVSTHMPAKGMPRLQTNIAAIDAILAKLRANPDLVAYKVEMHAYKYSWLLIPISLPLVWLLFPFDRRFGFYDHAVFVTYSLSFMTLLAVLVILVDSAGLDAADLLMVVVPPVHIYRQLRGTYFCSVPGALARTLALLVIAAVALLIFVGLIVAESAE